jgi:hypothetical protein
MSSVTSPAELDLMGDVELAKFARRQGNLSQLQLLTAVLDQQKATQSTAEVRRAVDEAAIRTAGATVKKPDDEMQTIIFGDQVTQAPPVQPQQSGLSKALLLAAALSTGGLAGAAVVGIPWLLESLKKPAQVAPVAPQPGTSTTIERDYEVGPVKIEPPSLFDLQEP